MVDKALEVRGCKVKITKVPIPVPFGPAFEGERIRKAEMHVEFGGNITTGFEFVTTADLNQINDGEIELIGPDIDQVEVGKALPLGLWVEVAGRKMQADFEPILERQIHHLLNGAEGIWHMGQRDIIWTRVSKAGYARGLRLKHYGEILHAKLISNYPAIVDKVKVTLITEQQEVEKRLAIARKVYDERNRRLETMTDESVDTFYSCLLCQSFAPNHVCMITPERLGLCGAYNWLDGKAAFEIDETGPNQPVKKGLCLDPTRGVWKGIDDFVYVHSHKTISSFSAYSIMDQPMTSCGCFEVICAYVPECNGVMAVNREFQGETPVGMTFSALAGTVGGGQQTPGFMGCGKIFVSSKKFLLAEGGHRRLIWMPKGLKEVLGEDLKKRFTEQGVPDLLNQIADETITTDAHAVRRFMEKVKHPALEMQDMSVMVESTTREKEESTHERVKKTTAPGESTAGNVPAEPKAETSDKHWPADLLAQIKKEIVQEIAEDLKATFSREIVDNVVQTLKEKFSGDEVRLPQSGGKEENKKEKNVEDRVKGPAAAERLSQITSFSVRKEKCEVPVWTVTLGATKKEGGTRGRSYTIGGETCMPFHLWEGEMAHRPLVAMEVFDLVNGKYPPVLRRIYGDLLDDPARMASVCVEQYDADLISVRLEGTHPEKGNRSAEDAVKVVRRVLEAVDVPLIITGHSHFEKSNEVMKAVAQAFAGENLLLNWVEQDNYRTIAGSALAYGHTLVAQSPIDVNIGKQLNILLTNMDVKPERIVMDPMTGAMGYGIEYTYSVMERMRMTALNGDRMLAGPMIVTPGQECVKIKEVKATEDVFPAWGDLEKRAALWELTTAVNLLYAGADLFIMYHPDAATALKRTIARLMDGKE
jgi:CO dehydrogenase/CO-methylating acetyl-CoA synthase complex beta subunit/CO dehydrogenase/acetyl-CoA synthase delta subunit